MKLIISGPISYESSGLLVALKQTNYKDVFLLADISPEENDILIATYSSLPLLGWSKYLEELKKMHHKWGCRMIVLVPPAYEVFVRSYLFDCDILPVNGSVDVKKTCGNITKVIKKKPNIIASDKKIEINSYHKNLLRVDGITQTVYRIAKKRNSSVKAVYQQRLNILKIIGFKTFSKWLIFSSNGFVEKYLK
ncbi:hypothetical protein [Hafnia paralvei]|uniref:hypothetical protein n=1 Tax=Hafnia paralvei TaxID=546367 RepID=UPI0010350E1C|nr:hypothetical protein [Hafnia paralvei]TBL64325.1 hypothetical protein EYY97_04250 [Hafnia paralvei]